MTIAARARRRLRRSRNAGFRAVTLGPGFEDWAVVDPRGRVVFRGDVLDAARRATELTRAG